MYRISKNEYLMENYTSILTYNGYEFKFFILIVQGDELCVGAIIGSIFQTH